MKQNWWKIFCVCLLFLTLFAGLLVPLAPGLITAESSAKSTFSGPFTVKVFGYNTHFKYGKNAQLVKIN